MAQITLCDCTSNSGLHISTSYFFTALICEPAVLTYRTVNINRSSLAAYNYGCTIMRWGIIYLVVGYLEPLCEDVRCQVLHMKKPTGTYAAVLTPHVAHKMVHCGWCTLVSIAIEALHKSFRLQCWLHLRVLSNRYTTAEESKHHHNIILWPYQLSLVDGRVCIGNNSY